MKSATTICALIMAFAATSTALAATNRTTRLGEIDAAADAPLLRLLESPAAAGAGNLANAGTGAASVPAVRAGNRPELPALTASVDDSEMWLMLVVAGGLVAFHLRRKQKALQYRPLSEAVYR